MDQNLFEKYGGFTTIHKVVEHFYDGVLDNDTLAPYFENADISQLIDHQTQFFASVMGGPASFDDNHLEKVHEGLRITEEAWVNVVEVLLNTLNAFNLQDKDIELIVGVIGRKKPLIVKK
ncbi:group I truncated hemoglobin [Arenicellales bacterium nBUS_45]